MLDKKAIASSVYVVELMVATAAVSIVPEGCITSWRCTEGNSGLPHEVQLRGISTKAVPFSQPCRHEPIFFLSPINSVESVSKIIGGLSTHLCASTSFQRPISTPPCLWYQHKESYPTFPPKTLRRSDVVYRPVLTSSACIVLKVASNSTDFDSESTNKPGSANQDTALASLLIYKMIYTVSVSSMNNDEVKLEQFPMATHRYQL
ncbi:hypothetical protein PM082_020509 [Marasmius tenuissimus]|nr:hypothetical protein PM082_020509 [Marasmius tenuissimus]